MFESDELIYVQMQKTACTHIASLLSRLFNGRTIGKHNAATEAQLASQKLVIASIRNPWDWYLSLWTFGVQGNGGFMRRVTTRNVLHSVTCMLRHPTKHNLLSVLHEFGKDVTVWRDVYDSSANIQSFRKWLRLIHNPTKSRCLGEGYYKTAIVNLCGFMTYRYLYLCCRNTQQLNNPRLISNYADIARFECDNCYVDNFIRLERLEHDLVEAIASIRLLTQGEKAWIHNAKKTNTSRRERVIGDYYDEDSIELVRQRDRLLIDKFRYSPPHACEVSRHANVKSS